MITETQSQAFDINDAFLNLLTADPFFAGYTARQTKMLPVQVELIPYLGVYMIDESHTPDGDANATCVRFSHTARTGFSVVLKNADQNALRKSLDQAFLRIMTVLWTDQKLMNVFVNSNPEGVIIESIVRGQRRHVFGNTGLNNETPFGELQYDVSAFWRSEWYPDITDDLLEINVKTGVKIGDTQAEMDQRQQVGAVHTFGPSMRLKRELREKRR
jgi:hypothetical protein